MTVQDTITTDDGSSRTETTTKVVAKDKDPAQVTVNPDAKSPRISGTQLSKPILKLLLRLLGIDEADVVMDKDGNVRAKEWDSEGQPGPMAGVNENDPNSKSWGSFIQTVLYLQAPAGLHVVVVALQACGSDTDRRF